MLLHQTGHPPVTLISKEWVTQRNPLSIVLYRITLVYLAEKIWVADTSCFAPFCADDAALDGLA